MDWSLLSVLLVTLIILLIVSLRVRAVCGVRHFSAPTPTIFESSALANLCRGTEPFNNCNLLLLTCYKYNINVQKPPKTPYHTFFYLNTTHSFTFFGGRGLESNSGHKMKSVYLKFRKMCPNHTCEVSTP